MLSLSIILALAATISVKGTNGAPPPPPPPSPTNSPNVTDLSLEKLAGFNNTLSADVVVPRGEDVDTDKLFDTGYWAQFCDDLYCSENCGISVQISNPNCLAESGRKSILYHGNIRMMPPVRIIGSSTDTCSCQAACEKVWNFVDCQEIDYFRGMKSFRFAYGLTCDFKENNCASGGWIPSNNDNNGPRHHGNETPFI